MSFDIRRPDLVTKITNCASQYRYVHYGLSSIILPVKLSRIKCVRLDFEQSISFQYERLDTASLLAKLTADCAGQLSDSRGEK